MRDLEVINKVKSFVSTESSGWKAKAQFRRANSGWLKKSTDIALYILNDLEAKGISQADLARLLEVTPQQVSKIVKGQENLTLETISRLEQALDIELIHINRYNSESNSGFHSAIETAKISETIEIRDEQEELKSDDKKVIPLISAKVQYMSEPVLKYYEK